jgi:hypothetical protein
MRPLQHLCAAGCNLGAALASPTATVQAQQGESLEEKGPEKQSEARLVRDGALLGSCSFAGLEPSKLLGGDCLTVDWSA